MDVLSEVLKVVRLQGAVFYSGEFSSPWSLQMPPSSTVAGYLPSAAGHVVLYHFLTEGRASARLVNGRSIALDAGDMVIVPHGDAHILENGPPCTTIDMSKELARIFSEGLKVSRLGGAGEATRFVCGYMSCEPRLSRVLLSGLPPLLKLTIRDDASGRWLEDAIRLSVDRAGTAPAGADAVLARLSELLFVETLRTYMAQLPAEQTGWLAGARDPEVGAALALIHRSPARRWSQISLAKEARVSPSALVQRFVHYLGGTPMAYLRHWRSQLGAALLSSTDAPVAQIAAELGYASEAAFNRAFERDFDLPPAGFRHRLQSVRAQRPPRKRRKATMSRQRRRGR